MTNDLLAPALVQAFELGRSQAREGKPRGIAHSAVGMNLITRFSPSHGDVTAIMDFFSFGYGYQKEIFQSE